MTIDYWKLDYEIVMTVLENYHDLSTGAKFDNSSDIDNLEIGKYGRGFHGPQEEMGMLCAEVARRVRLCGLDGMLVEERYGLNLMATPKTEAEIAEQRKLDLQSVFNRIRKVVWYCVGRNCKRESYEDWKRNRQYRKVEAKLADLDKTLDKFEAKV